LHFSAVFLHKNRSVPERSSAEAAGPVQYVQSIGMIVLLLSVSKSHNGLAAPVNAGVKSGGKET